MIFSATVSAKLERISILAAMACSTLAATAAVACDQRFQDSFIPYGPGLFSAATNLTRCGDYRVFVVYANGTDNLFMDRIVPTANESSLVAKDGMPFAEFNHYEASTEIESVTCKVLGRDRLQITGQAHSFHTDKSFRFAIDIDAAKRCYTYEDTQSE